MEQIPITAQHPWIALGDSPSTSAGTLPTPSQVTDSRSAPTEDIPNGKFVVRCPGPGIALIMFAMGESDGDTGYAAIICHSPVKKQSGTGTQYHARYVGQVSLTNGSVAANVSSASAIDSDDGGQLWVDTITVTNTDGTMEVIGRDGDGGGDGADVPDNHPMMLKVDLYGDEFLEIRTEKNTATGIRPVVKFVSLL